MPDSDLSLGVFCLVDLEIYSPNTVYISLFTQTELNRKSFKISKPLWERTFLLF